MAGRQGGQAGGDGVILPALHAILDAEAAARAGWRPVDLSAAFIRGGARLIQVRAKRLPSSEFLDLVRGIVAIAHPAGARVIVNDRADLAKIAGADGVHVGQNDVPVPEVRQLLGPEALVGFSTHSVEQLEQALTLPLSYVAVGPVFGTATKETGYAPVGLEVVGAAARMAAIPVAAIGGITLENAPAVLAAGASSVAVIADLLAGGDPERRVRQYVTLLGGSA